MLLPALTGLLGGSFLSILPELINKVEEEKQSSVSPRQRYGSNITGESGIISKRGSGLGFSSPVGQLGTFVSQALAKYGIGNFDWTSGSFSFPSSTASGSSSEQGVLDQIFKALNQNQMSLASWNNEQSMKMWREQFDAQTQLANTAHQREAADLRAAGFNPVLTAISGGMGSGAAVPSSSAQTFGASSSDSADLVMMIGALFDLLLEGVNSSSLLGKIMGK